jgi:hypothetical protein
LKKKRLKLVTIKVVERSRIKMEEMAMFGSPIHSIRGLIEVKV